MPQRTSLSDPETLAAAANPACEPCGISHWHPEARSCQMAGCPFAASRDAGPAVARDASPERERA